MLRIRWTGVAAGFAAAAVLGFAPLAQAASLTGIFGPGSTGPSVRELQTILDHHGYHIPTTGYFGPITEAAVKNFQATHRLATDGIVGPITERALRSSSTSSSASPRFQVARTATRRYTVRPGNTLSAIAARYRTTWQTLARLNHLAHPNILAVGEVLVLPGATSATTTHAQVTATRAIRPRTKSGSNSASLPVAAPRVSLDQAIVNTAFQYLGVPYVWGGASPAGFDCSGLVQYVLARNGIHIARTSSEQYAAVTPIARANLVPGDLVFFSTYLSGPSHVGIYIGAYPKLGYRQAFIDAPAPGQSVMVQNLNNVYWASHYYGAGAVRP